MDAAAQLRVISLASRLLIPVVGSASFFLLSLMTVRLLRPANPRKFFLAYALLLMVLAGVVSATWLPIASVDDAIGLTACLLLQLVACLTMWNAFYSLLWGFSGTMMYELVTDPVLRDLDRLIRSYAGDGEVDRVMARRLPNLIRGGWLAVSDRTLHLQPKGRLLAILTLASLKFFSLGMGGGVK